MNNTERAVLLHSLLRCNIVFFTYRKVNGEIRHAVGTRNLTLAEKSTGTCIPTPKGAEQPHSYYDIEKKEWRSYKPENLMSIDDYTPIPLRRAETKKSETPKNEPTEVEIPIYKPKGTGSPLCVPTDFKGLGKIIAGLDKGTPEGDKTTASIVSPQGEMTSIDQFARLVAKYVVDEIVARIK